VFDAHTSRVFGAAVGLEFAVAAAGAAALASRQRAELIPAWIALVVGVHLFPVAALLKYPLIYAVAALLTVAAIASVTVAKAHALPQSAVAGLAVGTFLLVAALLALGSALVRI